MSKIEAKLNNGTLCVQLAKLPEAKTHKVQISMGSGGGPMAIGGTEQQQQQMQA